MHLPAGNFRKRSNSKCKNRNSVLFGCIDANILLFKAPFTGIHLFPNYLYVLFQTPVRNDVFLDGIVRYDAAAALKLRAIGLLLFYKYNAPAELNTLRQHNLDEQNNFP